jgi:F-type H+-transporting ATPase subunit b
MKRTIADLWRPIHGAGMACLLAASAVAAEGAGGGHGGESGTPNIFSGDLMNSIYTLVIFLAVLLVLGKFAWGPVLRTLQRREQFIRESLEEAKKDREEAEKRLREYEERLHTARMEASSIVEEGRKDAETAKRRIHDQARAEAEAMLERAKREIGIARDTAVKELYQRVAEMATDVAGKVLTRTLTPDEHRRLMESSFAEIRTRVADHSGN